MSTTDTKIPEIILSLRQHASSQILQFDDAILPYLSQPHIRVTVRNPEGSMSRTYPVFQQNAMIYGDYSDYMKMHGCACCSLTSVLAAMRPSKAFHMPQDTIEKVEKKLLPRWEFEKNYEKSLERQMPISLYGISRILLKEGIQCNYVGNYNNAAKAIEVIDRHLRSGNPVIFETSRIRYRNGIIVRINDRKYAGSYHTMVMLGIDEQGMVVFTDSATRDWAGEQQRLKRAPLEELVSYMFPQKKPGDTHAYFHGRRNTGGFILVQAWERKVENTVQKAIKSLQIGFDYPDFDDILR